MFKTARIARLVDFCQVIESVAPEEILIEKWLLRAAASISEKVKECF
jgi:hypothetical protein